MLKSNVRVAFEKLQYIILFKPKEYLCTILVFSCRFFIFRAVYSLNKDENWFLALKPLSNRCNNVMYCDFVVLACATVSP